jgi:uncharacterized phage-associated protein
MPNAIRFPYDRERAVNAVLWLLGRHNGTLEKLKLVKLLFYADRAHLAKYGRPITGGMYSAMPHGPVASALYDDLKSWDCDVQHAPVRISGKHVTARKQLDAESLSESDVEILTQIDREYGGLSALALRAMTHRLKAYKKNFHPGAGIRSFPLPYEDFFLDLPKNSILDILRDDQEARAVFQQ